MDLKNIALALWPSWLLGLFMVVAVYRSQFKDLLKIDKKAIIKWILILCFFTCVRILMVEILKLIGVPIQIGAVKDIPIAVLFFVFWEDACHTLPLLLLKKLTNNMAAIRLATLFMAISFGLGHIYQGVHAAILMSLYIPVTLRIAEEKGLGTVMIGHTLYDLFTCLFIKWILS